MAHDLKQLQEELEHNSENGVGVGIFLPWLEEQCKISLDNLAANPIKGVNIQIGLPMSTEIQAGFAMKGNQFHLDTSTHTVSLSIEIFLHMAGQATEELIRFSYEIKDAPLESIADQSTFEVSLQPVGHIIANQKGPWKYNEPDAAAYLMNLGYIIPPHHGAAALPDYARFEREIVVPFTWLNAQGLVLAIFRSLPVPQLMAGFSAIRPLVPVYTYLSGTYLLVWTESGSANLPICGAEKPSGPPQSAGWKVRDHSPNPSSPADESRTPFALYFSAQTLVRWHADFLMPAVMISHSGSFGPIGWRYDGAVGLESLLIELVPGKPNTFGGGIEAHAVVDFVGAASSWINGPCGIRIGLVTATLQGTGHVDVDFDVTWDQPALRLKSALTITAGLDRPHVSIGTFAGNVEQEIVDILLDVGRVNLDTIYKQRSESTLLDWSTLLPLPWDRYIPRYRVGNKSAMIFVKRGD